MLVPLVLSLTHMLTCFLWYISTVENRLIPARPEEEYFNPSWWEAYRGLGVENIRTQGSVIQQYAISFYWVTATLSTNGQLEDLKPRTLKELYFTILVMLFSVTVYLYILGETANVVMKQDEELVSRRSTLLMARRFVE